MIGLGLARKVEDCERFFGQTGKNASYPLYRAPWVAKAYGVSSVPTVLILDAEGRELFRAQPPSTSDPLAMLDARLTELLAAQ